MTKLSELTTEHLGREATTEDLETFRFLAALLAERDGLTEEEAVDTLWGDGDFYENAERLGIAVDL